MGSDPITGQARPPARRRTPARHPNNQTSARKPENLTPAFGTEEITQRRKAQSRGSIVASRPRRRSGRPVAGREWGTTPYALANGPASLVSSRSGRRPRSARPSAPTSSSPLRNFLPPSGIRANKRALGRAPRRVPQRLLGASRPCVISPPGSHAPVRSSDENGVRPRAPPLSARTARRRPRPIAGRKWGTTPRAPRVRSSDENGVRPRAPPFPREPRVGSRVRSPDENGVRPRMRASPFPPRAEATEPTTVQGRAGSARARARFRRAP